MMYARSGPVQFDHSGFESDLDTILNKKLGQMR
jgi:hypothetical protein